MHDSISRKRTGNVPLNSMLLALVAAWCLCPAGGLFSVEPLVPEDRANVTVDPKLFDGLRYRSLGFSRSWAGS